MKNLKEHVLLELKRDKKRAILLAALLLVAAVLFVRLLLKRPGPSAAKAVGMAETTAGTRAVECRGRSTPTMADEATTRKIDATITRNIFIPPERYFPSLGSGKKASAPVAGDRNTERDNAWRDASAMTLASTILSATPKAIIDGQLVQVGDTIKGFQVKQISSRAVTLERDGVSVELEMKGEP